MVVKMEKREEIVVKLKKIVIFCVQNLLFFIHFIYDLSISYSSWFSYSFSLMAHFIYSSSSISVSASRKFWYSYSVNKLLWFVTLNCFFVIGLDWRDSIGISFLVHSSDIDELLSSLNIWQMSQIYFLQYALQYLHWFPFLWFYSAFSSIIALWWVLSVWPQYIDDASDIIGSSSSLWVSG